MNAPTRALAAAALVRATAPVLAAGLMLAAALAAAPSAHAQQTFDIIVSLEADPLGDDDRIADYEDALRDFSNAVFEASEGAHAIGNITVYTASFNHENADVVWHLSGHPASALNGLSGPGQIYMVDTFTGGGLEDSDADLLDDADDTGIGTAGAILAHEWAHYAYGLLDEHVVASGDEPVARSLMSSPWDVVNDRSSAAFSITADDSSDDFRNTEKTEHHRAYGQSGWELLGDMPDAEDALLAPVPGEVDREFFQELADAAPSGVPILDGDAADPTITWRGPCSSYAIAIDNSGSMLGQRLEDARDAAGLLIDRTVAERTWVSILTFANAPDANFRTPATLVSDEGDPGETTRDQLFDALNAIASIPVTTRFSAGVNGGKIRVDDGLAEIASAPSCDPNRIARALFFLSDGSNSDPDGSETDDLKAAREAFAADGIPIHVVDYGNRDPDATSNPMTPLVAGTGGRLVIALLGGGPIDRLFEESENQFRPETRLHQSDVLTFPVSPNGFGGASFPVDADTDRLDICITSDIPIGNVFLDSQSIPSIVLPTVTRTTETVFPECTAAGAPPVCPLVDECSTFYSVANASADPGFWTVFVEAADDADETARVSVTAKVHTVREATTLQFSLPTATAAMSGQPGDPLEVVTPAPVFVSASLVGRLPAAGARLFASLGNTGIDATLRDDGLPPDTRAGDGIYVGALPTEGVQDGTYEVSVTATNALGVAAISPRGLVRAPNQDGRRAAPEDDLPLSAVLFRYLTAPVTIIDGGLPSTIVNEIPQNGQIAVPGEIDSYSVDLMQVGSGPLQIRLTAALLGMIPRLTVFSQTGTAITATALPNEGGVGIDVDSSLGLVNVEVENASGGTGTYQISAGAPLTQDFPASGSSDSPCDLAMSDKNDALAALQSGLAGTPAAIALIEESRGLTGEMIRGLKAGRGQGQQKKVRRFLERASKRDRKALKRLRDALDDDRSKELEGARRKIKNARRKLSKACSRLADGGASLRD